MDLTIMFFKTLHKLVFLGYNHIVHQIASRMAWIGLQHGVHRNLLDQILLHSPKSIVVVDSNWTRINLVPTIEEKNLG
jgi:hypothetical protein